MTAAAEPRPPRAICPSCGRQADVKWLHAESGEPAWPRCGSCDVQMQPVPEVQPFPIAYCGSCGAEIIWAVTAAGGKFMPIDAAPTDDGNVELAPHEFGGKPTAFVYAQRPLGNDAELRLAHHYTCPQGKEWSRHGR